MHPIILSPAMGNCRTDCDLGMATGLEEGKLWIQTYKTSLTDLVLYPTYAEVLGKYIFIQMLKT